MRFRTKNQCSPWCDIGNDLPLKVEIVCARYAVRARKTGDPRLKLLAREIHKLQMEFQSGLNKAMRDIREADLGPLP